MKNPWFKFAPVIDLELLDNIIFYLNRLCPNLLFSCLQHHCKGAMASIFELSFYLTSHNLKDYGNNEK